MESMHENVTSVNMIKEHKSYQLESGILNKLMEEFSIHVTLL